MFDLEFSWAQMLKIVLNNICAKSTDHNPGSISWAGRDWWRGRTSSGPENKNLTLTIFTIGLCLATKLVISVARGHQWSNCGHFISMLFQASSSPTWRRPPAPAGWAPPPPVHSLRSLSSAPRAPRPPRVPQSHNLIWKMTADLSRWWLMSRTQVIIFCLPSMENCFARFPVFPLRVFTG